MGSKDVSRPISFVSAVDLAGFIGDLVKKRENIEKYRAYNLCFRENLTNQEFILRIVIYIIYYRVKHYKDTILNIKINKNLNKIINKTH